MSYYKPARKVPVGLQEEAFRQIRADLRMPFTGSRSGQDRIIDSGGAEDVRRLEYAKGQQRVLDDIARRKAIKQSIADNPLLSERPAGWQKPPFMSEEYREEMLYKRISYEEFEVDQRNYDIRRKRALAGMAGGGRAPTKRELREEPRESRQYANHMATTAARDRRLVPMARVALQWIRAMAGTGIQARFTKYSMAEALGVSVRSAQRYIAALKQFGYLETQIRKNDRGLHTGLIAFITQKVLPFWRDDKRLGSWLMEVETLPQPFDWTGVRERYTARETDLFTYHEDRETKLSPKNYSPNMFYNMQGIAPLMAGMFLNRQRE